MNLYTLSKKPKILVLTCTAGSGHLSAALAFEEAFIDRNIAVSTIDVTEYMNPGLAWIYKSGWLYFIKFFPGLFERLYARATRKTPSYPKLSLLFTNIFLLRALVFIKKLEPSCIIATHPLCGALAVLHKKRNKNCKTVMQTTDFQLLEMQLFPEIDLVLTLASDIEACLQGRSFPREQVLPFGPPVLKKFLQEKNLSEIREEQGVTQGAVVILVSIGGIGGLGISTRTVIEYLNELSQLSLDSPVHILVACGRNTALKTKLESLFALQTINRLHFFAYTKKMDDLLAICSLHLCKPGGLSLAETLAMGKKVITFAPLPGIQNANIRFIEKQSFGRHCRHFSELNGLVRELLQSKDLTKADKNKFAVDSVLDQLLSEQP